MINIVGESISGKKNYIYVHLRCYCAVDKA